MNGIFHGFLYLLEYTKIHIPPAAFIGILNSPVFKNHCRTVFCFF